jgi:hypothetical protein
MISNVSSHDPPPEVILGQSSAFEVVNKGSKCVAGCGRYAHYKRNGVRYCNQCKPSGATRNDACTAGCGRVGVYWFANQRYCKRCGPSDAVRLGADTCHCGSKGNYRVIGPAGISYYCGQHRPHGATRPDSCAGKCGRIGTFRYEGSRYCSKCHPVRQSGLCMAEGCRGKGKYIHAGQHFCYRCLPSRRTLE